MKSLVPITATLALSVLGPAVIRAQEPPADDTTALKQDLIRERAALAEQRRALEAQEQRLERLENRLNGSASAPPAVAGATAPSGPTGAVTTAQAGVETVGQAPKDEAKSPPVAALGDQGGVFTRRHRLTLEADLEYAHADQNEVIFRGIEVPQSVLVGVFDINQTRQDVLNVALLTRFGLTQRLEVNVRVPYTYRSDASRLPPVTSTTSDSTIGTQESSAHALHVGDVEFGLRYQFTDGHNGLPYLIGGLQVLSPTGTSPYTVPRDTLGNPTRSATGAGFWAVQPVITALLPSDPAVLFASLGYTQNIGRSINRTIGDAYIDRVRPGGEPSLNLGIGVSLNPRVALSFGYAHTWSFGTKTSANVLSSTTGSTALGPEVETTSRDLQIGQYIFGVNYRFSEQRALNWTVAIGATNDAPAVVTTFRFPFGFDF